MKIAYVCPNFYLRSETFIRDLANGLSKGPDLVRVLTDRVAEYARAGSSLDIRETPFLRRPSVVTRAVAAAASRLQVAPSIHRHRLEVRRARSALLPALQDFDPDVIYADYGPTGVLLDGMAEELRKPLVVHFHGYDASAALCDEHYAESLSALIRRGRQIIVPSAHLGRLLIIASGVPGNMSVIPYLPAKPPVDGTPKTAWPSVIALGRLTGKKSPLALLEAFAIVHSRMPEARLTMIGEGPLRAEVERRVSERGLSGAVKLLGALPHDEALRVMASHWVFAQHSVTSIAGDQEGLPVSILEAMLSGVPVVSTVHSGIPEAVEHGTSGLLAREHDFETMAAHIESLLRDAGLRDRIAEKARQSVIDMSEAVPRFASVRQVLARAVGAGPSKAG